MMEPSSKPSSCMQKVQGSSLRALEAWFQTYGEFVARHPAAVIGSCLLLTCVCGSGLYWFRMENEGVKLWIPYNSDYRLNSDWMFENFPRDLRFNSLIFTAPNILTADVIRAMYRASKSIRSLVNSNNNSWTDMCMKRPVIKPPDLSDILGRRRRDLVRQRRDLVRQRRDLVRQRRDLVRQQRDDDFGEDLFDDDEEVTVSMDSLQLATQFSVDQYPSPYCGIVEKMPLACLEMSILELFGDGGEYTETSDRLIEELTDEQVIDTINYKNKSEIFLLDYNFTSYLSGVRRDERGRIVAAGATYMLWLGKMNMSVAKNNPNSGVSEPTDPRMFDWEGDMLQIMQNKSHYPEGLHSYPNVARSFGDIAGGTILEDVSFFVAGYVLMFGYATLMLGKPSCVEHRTFLATIGIYGVIMGIIVSYGFCSMFGVFYGPMHSVMPFLMLGIGIDDMFVIVQCWDTLTQEERSESLERRFGFLMRQAGASITVTSATDVIAFGIGAFTILPALKSFCIYASVGIVATFIFQASFFVAWMSIDQRRIESNRNGCCPCYVHEAPVLPPGEENAIAQSILQRVFKRIAELLVQTPVRILVLLLTVLATGFGVYGNILLRQEFDPTWFLPTDTYIAQWFQQNKLNFPSSGERGTIYFSGTQLPEDVLRIERLAAALKGQPDIVTEVNSWTGAYLEYVEKLGYTGGVESLNQTAFRASLTQFLFSPKGGEYKEGFKFEQELKCGVPASAVLLSQFTYTHRLMNGPTEHVPAMNQVKEMIRASNLTGKVFAMALGYATWETDEIISLEIYRNMALALLCVFLTTLLFISNLSGAVLILFCVCLTLVDVGGFMHFWGLTIDTVSCNNLIIAIGLCVDYSAHIMHRFLTEQGDRRERVVRSLANIGPAVFNGGFSTFLAFVLLAGSKSHVFSSFFKIFFLVVSFGLFHGLIVLPVMLSFLGPSSTHYAPVHTQETAENRPKKQNETVF